jgi:hypothetical protein
MVGSIRSLRSARGRDAKTGRDLGIRRSRLLAAGRSRRRPDSGAAAGATPPTVSAVSGRRGKASEGHRKDARGMSVGLGLVMALSVSRLGQGKRGKPGPRSPTCRELTYPAPRGSLVLPASSGKRLLLRDTYDSVAVALARPAHGPETSDDGSAPQPRIDRLVDKWRASHPLPLPRLQTCFILPATPPCGGRRTGSASSANARLPI